MPLVSVVIPIYNAQPYLRQCLDSIKAQTLRDIEIICVNDGSTDDSLEVMNEYAADDPRFVVLDKPNGGYGHSMNYGIAHATGEFIAIVEPDDFIHPEMYADLVSYANYGGTPADVVKSSYWEFFDGRDGYDDMLVQPPLSKELPKSPFSFKLEDNTRVIEYHPSIWSAIYRRSFLEEFGIRFIEPKGAGWADNPFMMETLVCARSIVWVPKEYYYYRQTNPGASSFLKDYHVPFDRIDDMTEVLKRRNAAKSIWEALYLREFYYIDSVTEEFGFDGRNPELQELIMQTVANMDGSIVLSSTMLPPSLLARYASIMRLVNADDESADETERADAPILTYIIPASREARWAIGALESIAHQQIDSFEAIIVDCGATDNTMSLCKSYVRQDHRFRILERETGAEGLNVALAQAKGFYTYICNMRQRFIGNSFAEALLYAAEQDIDMVLLDTRSRFVVDALRAESCQLQPHRELADGIIIGPLSFENVSTFALNCSFPHERSFLVRTDLLRKQNAGFGKDDVYGDGLLAPHALLAAKRFAYLGAQLLERDVSEHAFILSTLEIRDWKFDSQKLALPAALSLAGNQLVRDKLSVSLHNLIAEAFVYDLLSRRTADSLTAYYREYDSTVQSTLAKLLDTGQPFDAVAAEGLQLLRQEGLSGFLIPHYLNSDIYAKGYRIELAEVGESRLYKLADQIRSFSMNILPKELISRIRGSIAASN